MAWFSHRHQTEIFVAAIFKKFCHVIRNLWDVLQQIFDIIHNMYIKFSFDVERLRFVANCLLFRRFVSTQTIIPILSS